MRAEVETRVGFAVASDPFQLPSAPAFPVIGEGESVPAPDVNGIEQSLLVGSGREISVVFTDEYSKFKNSFGVFEIGADGRLGNVRVLAPEVEHAAADPDFPRLRPGGGPLEAGESFSLGVVPEGTKFGFFIVSNGFGQNPASLFRGPGSWELRDQAGGEADLGDTGGLRLFRITTAADDSTVATAVKGVVFVSADSDTSSPNVNPLNPDGMGHVISGLDSSSGTIVFGFDDQTGGVITPDSDRDFNDVVFAVRYGEKPAEVAFIPEVETALRFEISDADSALMRGASAALGGATSAGDTISIAGFTDADGDGRLDGTGIRLERVSVTEIRLSGEDSIAHYEQVLAGLRYDNDVDPLPGVRELTLTVTDDKGAVSDPFKVAIAVRDLLVTGDSGNDLLVGSVDDDGIQGEGGNDTLRALDGDDLIDGGAGDDRLDGGAGDDKLFGGTGKDVMTGGAGKDSFVIGSLVLGTETVTDFDSGEGDRLDLGQLMQGGGYRAGVSNDADFFRLLEIDANADGSANDVQVQVDVDGRGKAFTFQAVANLTSPGGVTGGSPIEQVVATAAERPSDGATS
jgi:Ca2+-binding RTX toxin-like protein